jgi:hypothetical protein
VTSPAELLVAEMRSRLDGQVATLESARTRAAVVLSVSGVIAGLFAQHLSHHIGNWGLAALATFVVGGIPAVWILGPHKLTVSPQGDDWIRFATQDMEWSKENPAHASGDLGAAELAVQMVPSMRGWGDDNEKVLKWIHKAIVIAGAGVIVQMACWVGASVFLASADPGPKLHLLAAVHSGSGWISSIANAF